MKVYFAGAIRGGREKVYDYQKMVKKFEDNNCNVLTKHVADPNLSQSGEKLTPREIYDRDCKWLKEADIVFADITIPSLGVGYEIAKAEVLFQTMQGLYEDSTSEFNKEIYISFFNRFIEKIKKDFTLKRYFTV